ncbi:MAG: antitoxin [Chloroflexi bacterium]|nr:antitoxin [Chloroflexota bacterium]
MKTAKLFKNGQSQAVRLPKEFRFAGDRVFIKKLGNAVVLLPYQNAWQSLLDSLNMFSDDFMETREQPPEQIREDLFTRHGRMACVSSRPPLTL